jgi:hypothetical protein
MFKVIVNTEVVELQQVLNGRAHMCLNSSAFTLKLAESNHTGMIGIHSLLALLGSSIHDYFDESNLPIPVNGSGHKVTVIIL